MRRREMQADQERLAARSVFANFRKSAVDKEMGQISRAFDSLVSLEQDILANLPESVGKVIGSAGRDPEEAVVAAVERTVFGRPAHVPFPDQRSAVACRLQN